jgi:hypothetical protein
VQIYAENKTDGLYGRLAAGVYASFTCGDCVKVREAPWSDAEKLSHVKTPAPFTSSRLAILSRCACSHLNHRPRGGIGAGRTPTAPWRCSRRGGSVATTTLRQPNTRTIQRPWRSVLDAHTHTPGASTHLSRRAVSMVPSHHLPRPLAAFGAKPSMRPE